MIKKYLLNLVKIDDMDLETRKPTMTKRFWTFIGSKRQDNVGVAPLEINDDVVSDSPEKANLLSNYFKSKSRLSLIVGVNVVLNRTVVVDSD